MGLIKVIHICDKFGMRGSTTHGVSRFFLWSMPRFDSEKYDVTLYALKKPDPSSRALEESGAKLTYLNQARISPAILSCFVSLIRREKPDILHLHGWIAANFGRMAGRLTRIPTIMHEHGVDPYFPKSQQIADRVLSPMTHTALAVSNSVREFLVSRRYVHPSKLRLIYLGAPLSQFEPAGPAEVAQLKESLGIPEDSPVVGTVGRIDTQKGLTYLIKAGKSVFSRIPNARFVIVGDGPKMEELQSEAKELGIQENILFIGHRNDVQLIQSMIDIQAFPSLWEGTPLTIFEAMAMGLPIVSTGVDGLGEVLEDGKSALIVPPAESKALADAIVRLLQDRNLALSLASGARESGRKYDISQTVRNMETLYDELCDSRNGHR